MKKFCDFLWEHVLKIINFLKKKFLISMNHMKMQKSVIFVEKSLKINMIKIKKYCKVRDHLPYTGEYRGATDSICNLKYSTAK